MAVIPQKNRPIGIVVLDDTFGSGVGGGIPWFTLLSPRPEDLQYTYPSRATVVQTFDGGFVDDFGEGLVDIIATGTTGWSDPSPGELMFVNLRDWIVLRFHALRQAKAAAGLSINSVHMYWVDTLNLQVYEVYPVSFTGRKNKQRPLLFQYTMRLVGVNRVIGPSMLTGLFG